MPVTVYLFETLQRELSYAEMDANFKNLRDASSNVDISGMATKSSTVLTDTLTVNTDALKILSSKRVLLGATDNGVDLLQVAGSVVATSFNSITGLSSVTPLMNGLAAIGDSTAVARANHIHPTDSSLAAKSSTILSDSLMVNTDALVVDSSKRVGIGSAPSAWGSVMKSIDIGSGGSSIADYNGVSLYFNSNAYYNGSSWVYKIDNAARQFIQSSGGDAVWNHAATGTAANAITWVEDMRLTLAGELLVGTPTTDGVNRLQVNGPGKFIGTVTANAFSGRVYPYASILGSGADVSYSQMYAGSTSGSLTDIVVYGGGNATPNIIKFSTASVERVRITAAGDFCTNVNTAAPTIPNNKMMSFYLVSNTSLKIQVKGSDGTTRSTTLTLA